MAPRPHASWRPQLLRQHRDALGLTLDEVAEAVRNLAGVGFLPPDATFQSVGRHERGEVFPGPRYRRAYCVVYGRSEAELGFRAGLPASTSTKRADAASGSALNQSAAYPDDLAVAAEALPALWEIDTAGRAANVRPEPAAPFGAISVVPADVDNGAGIDAGTALRCAHEWLVTEPPQVVETRTGRRVGEAFTRKVEGRVAQLRRLDDFVGGRDLHELVARELAATTAVLDDAAYDERLGLRLLSAVAELCQLAGWVAMDAGRTQAARRFYLDGVKAAHAAGNSPVAANLISTLSYQFANQHDPRTAVLLAQTALHGAENSATPATLALLHERIAWAYAKAGDRSTAEKALAAVERYHDQRRPDDEPTWVYWLDDNEIDVMAGRCYVELGLPERAEPLLVDAVARCDEDRAREAALYRSWLAEAYVQTGDLDRAVEEAKHVVRLDARAGSARASDRVQHLRTRLTAFRDDPTVRVFEDLYRSEYDLRSAVHRPS